MEQNTKLSGLASLQQGSDHLRPATQDEIGETLAFALRFNGRRRVQTAEDAMARITAERLVEHLNRSGFVVMKRPDQPAPSTSGHRHPNAD